MTEKAVIAFIPVRGGSKGIPGKNIRPFCGRPLVWWAIKAASECQAVGRIVVSTDSAEIARVVTEFGFSRLEIHWRSGNSAHDTASTESAMIEFASEVQFDDIVLIQATSPLLESSDLDRGFDLFRRDNVDSCLSVVRQKRFYWEQKGDTFAPVNYDPLSRPMRQAWGGQLVENGAFYITSRERLLSTGSRISGRIACCEMNEESYFEIDEPSDWRIAEGLKRQALLRAGEGRLPGVGEIRLLVCDVDGVLTDGGMYYSDDGSEIKKFNTRDGMGLTMVQQTGVSLMFLTGEDNELVRRRAKKLAVDYYAPGVKDKAGYLAGFFAEHTGFSWASTMYIGDDVNDLEAMCQAGYSAAPADASPVILDTAGYVCRRSGGEGCVREVCEILMGVRW
jgi:N-acylneuraminate cytidylyltransferase